MGSSVGIGSSSHHAIPHRTPLFLSGVIQNAPRRRAHSPILLSFFIPTIPIQIGDTKVIHIESIKSIKIMYVDCHHTSPLGRCIVKF
jgi:hypothetical protein